MATVDEGSLAAAYDSANGETPVPKKKRWWEKLQGGGSPATSADQGYVQNFLSSTLGRERDAGY